MLQVLDQGSLDQGGEGFSDWSIQEEPSSQATLAVILLGDPFSPLSFFFPPPLLTVLKVFETIVDQHSVIFEVAALAVDKNAKEVGSGVAK